MKISLDFGWIFWSLPVSQSATVRRRFGLVLFSAAPLSELNPRSHAHAEVFIIIFFFASRTGALLRKMSCQDAKLEIEDPDAYYAALYAPPLGV